MNKRNPRDLGLKGGSPGKGDAPRYTHNENWIRNYEAINWNRKTDMPYVPPSLFPGDQSIQIKIHAG